MSEQTLKFGDTVVNKKEFHASKQAIALNLVKNGKILINLNTVMMVLNIVLAIYIMMMQLDLCVLFDLK